MLDDLFYCGNEILLGGSLHHIKVAALLRPDPGESAEPFALGIENVEPQHLVIVILSRLKRLQRRFGHGAIHWPAILLPAASAAIAITAYSVPVKSAMMNATAPITGGISMPPVEAQASSAAA